MTKNVEKRLKGFSCEDAFDLEAFLSPSIDYSPVYTWMWNAEITREQTDAELDEMQLLGIKRFYILPMPKSFRPTSFPTPLTPEYLSEGYFEAYRYAIEGAKKRGMQVWLYDEGGWPSGGACGQVVLEDPSLVSETIAVKERNVTAGERYENANAEAAFFEGKRVFSGEVFSKDGTLFEYERKRTSFPHINSADLPDITKRGATETFLRLTHEKYASALSDFFGDTVTAVFTDEPTAPRPFPYTDEIKALFEKTFEEPIENYLPVLLGKAETDEKTATVKANFFDLLGKLFCERFLNKEAHWSHDSKMLFLGHLDKDDEANGSMTGGNFGLLRALRCFDVPGVDAIRRQIFPPKGRKGLYGENKFFPRYASSAAAQRGGRHALSESFAVYGCGLSYDEMRYVLNFQAMRGINVFNCMVTPYGRKGYQMAGLLPHFTQTTHPDLKEFNRYAARLSYLFSTGKRVANAALYVPIRDGFAGERFDVVGKDYEELGKELERRHILFDLADDDLLENADAQALARGVLAMGEANYTVLVIPACKHMTEKSLSSLQRFVAGGGKVVTRDPVIAARVGVAASDLSSIPSPSPISDPEISYAESETAQGKLCFYMNESGENKVLTLPVANDLAYVIDMSDGNVTKPLAKQGSITLSLCSGEIVALLFSQKPLAAESPFVPEKEIVLGEWKVRRTERLLFEETPLRLTLNEEVQPLPQDPRAVFPSDFSGSAEYQTSCTLPIEVKRAVLDLGKTEGAAEAFWNGVSLGVKIMPPYRFEVPTSLLSESAEIRVRVTNTPANAFEHSPTLAALPAWKLGNYLKEESLFHRDSERGGMLGESKLLLN